MSTPLPSPRFAAIERLRHEIEQLSSHHSQALQAETFLGTTLQDSNQNEQRRAALIELVKQLEVFGNDIQESGWDS